MDLLKACALMLALCACSYDTDALRTGAAGGAGGSGGSECNEVAGTGCAPGERCTVCVRPNTSRSQGCAAGGDKAAGEACAAQAECSPGTVCWNADTGTTYVCRHYCNSDADCYAEAPLCRKFKDYACDFMPGVTASFGLCYMKL